MRQVYVRHLGLRDFRSWARVELDLEPGRTVFVGRNGFGKTNLVEALWYSTTLGSHRVGTEIDADDAGGAAHETFCAMLADKAATLPERELGFQSINRRNVGNQQFPSGKTTLTP